VHELEEGRSLTLGGLSSLDHGCLDVLMRASAARPVAMTSLLGLLVSAGRLLADKLALGAVAQSGLLALPVALGLLAHGGAHSLGGSACSPALGRCANSLALGAVSGFAQILGATNIALGLVAMNLACGTRGLLAVDLALRSLTH